MKNLVLIVDDDVNICNLLQLYLEKDGFATSVVNDGKSALEFLRENNADVVLLDIMMPGMDGYETLKSIREFSRIPVIMLSAKSEMLDKINGFDYGADDYVTKPFEPQELISRVRALIRRTMPQSDAFDEITIGNLSVNIKQYQVLLNGKKLEMPPKEIEVLNFLAKNPDRVVTRDELVSNIWSNDYKGDSRTVDVHIKRIREKIVGASCSLLTVWGVGYKLEVK